MNSRKFQVALLLVLSFLLVTAAFAQTSETGAITGKVSQAGTALPGVTIEVRSPNLQGVRTDVTDAQGNFRFTLLPPGNYSLTSSLSGFNVVKQQNIAVGIGRTVTLDVTMSPAAAETIVVTGAAPVVDVTSNTSGANVTAETMRTLPIARNFVAASQVAPGTAVEQTGAAAGSVTVYGSSGAENEYVIDGLNTTGVNTGLQGKRLNVEFIQETEVITGGLGAEYGRSTGGIINAVTKSGSNEFHGDAFGYKAGGALLSNPKYQKDLPATSTTISDTSTQNDFGANLGGYIMKDRLWFFGAYDRVKQTDQSIRINVPLDVPGFSVPVGGKIPTGLTRDLYAGKLNFALTSNHQLSASLFGDPSKTDGAQFGIAGPPSTFLGENKTGGTDVVGRYSGVIGTSWNVNASLGQHKEKSELTGEGTTTSRLQDVTVVPNVNSGGFVGFNNSKYKRKVGKLDVSAFLGNHTFKFGGDQEKLDSNIDRFYGNGDWVRKFCKVAVTATGCPAGQEYYRHEVFLNDQTPGFVRSDPTTWQAAIANPLTVAPKTENTAWYVQDSWKTFSNLTLNLGVRYEQQKVGDRFGAWIINLKDNWAPRIGAIWDPSNNGRSKAYANFGRFYETMPMDINIRSFGGELSLDVNNLSPTSRNLTPNPSAPAFSATRTQSRILGAFVTPVDPNLKAQYVDEYLLGYDYEIASNLAIGIKGTYRNLGRVIEDMLSDPATGEYLIANPGSGIGATTGYLVTGEQVPAPKATRRYKGVELHATKRFSNNYQFFTSYTWSKLTGNYDGTFQSSTGQLDPNINSAYDYADFEVNNSGGGSLSNDRTHMLKFYGSYTLPSGMARGLELGVGSHYYSGTPLTAMGYAGSYRNYEYYLTPRGSLGRGPADYDADVHLGYPVPIAGNRLHLLLDVFSLFNRQAKTTLDQRYNLSSDPPCAGIPDALCNGDGGLLNKPGTTDPLGTLPNPKATATNPNFLKAGSAFSPQRSIRLGARFSF
jgi:hypothetical protein